MSDTTSNPVPARGSARRDELLDAYSARVWARTDRLFAGLMAFQFVVGIATALWLSPRTWIGASSSLHIHVWSAVWIGAVISALPIYLAFARPGAVATRHVVAIAQMCWSALLIHLSGGRIETHFHVFGSLAFLAFYRDWRVLVTAVVVVAGDHMLRGIFWPQSVFGIASASHWRWVEHAGWVVFEVVFLAHACIRRRDEMIEVIDRRVEIERTRDSVEQQVVERTQELEKINESLLAEQGERFMAEMERDELNLQLVQSQKLEAIGQLAAGIAHEINTPTQYVGDNTRFLQETFESLVPVLDRTVELIAAVHDGRPTEELAKSLEASLEEADVEYILEEFPVAIEQSLAGIERVRKIVRSMKEFSHPGADGMSTIDLNAAIENTVVVSSNEWKYVAEVRTELDDQLPPVTCLPGEIGQVVLNLIVNAAHAIGDRFEDGEKGTILVTTRLDGSDALISVTDNGSGIPEAARERIFDPFFTTKEVGKGTGQGLAISYSVVVNKHGGTLRFETAIGQGTTFFVRIPIEQQIDNGDEPSAVAA